MTILRTLAHAFQRLFPRTESGQERFRWFVVTLQAILVPIAISGTSNLLRAIETLFGVSIAQWRCYTFVASVKLPWEAVWRATARSCQASPSSRATSWRRMCGISRARSEPVPSSGSACIEFGRWSLIASASPSAKATGSTT
jgi:hypothetical protein